MMHLSQVQLKNIRCFKSLDLDFGEPTDPASCTVIVGDNATGKTALLRSIAIGLCDEASAAGLMKESDEGYIRRGCADASIKLDLKNPSHWSKGFRIKTSIDKKGRRRGSFDRLRQRTGFWNRPFPWDELFIAAYGADRGVAGTGDIAGYSPINAVYNLFNYAEGLQNPELMLWRHSNSAPIEDALAQFSQTERVHREASGIFVDGPWGQHMPLRDLADGYKGAILWLTDLLGWIIAYEPELTDLAEIQGIVLVDEIEEHMHARWQRTVIHDLRSIFPRIQFIVTTHSPIIASSIGRTGAKTDNDKLFVLELGDENRVTAYDHEHMKGWRMDQVLASRAFRYQVHAADNEFRQALVRGSELLAKEKLSPTEEKELSRIKHDLHGTFFDSNSPIQHEVESETWDALRSEVHRLERKLFPNDSA
jgi:predicted ATP-binding protein involved in virulence